MSRRLLVAPATLAVLLCAGACTSSGTQSAASSTAASSTAASSTAASTAGASSAAAVCQAADQLRASVNSLSQVDVVKQGTSAVQQSLAQIKSDIADLTTALRGHDAPEVQQVQSDVTAVQSALDQAKAGPSAQTIGALATEVRSLVQSTRALLSAVGSSC